MSFSFWMGGDGREMRSSEPPAVRATGLYFFSLIFLWLSFTLILKRPYQSGQPPKCIVLLHVTLRLWQLLLDALGLQLPNHIYGHLNFNKLSGPCSWFPLAFCDTKNIWKPIKRQKKARHACFRPCLGLPTESHASWCKLLISQGQEGNFPDVQPCTLNRMYSYLIFIWAMRHWAEPETKYLIRPAFWTAVTNPTSCDYYKNISVVILTDWLLFAHLSRGANKALDTVIKPG